MQEKTISKILVPKFTRPDVVDELTRENIEDIIHGQKIEIENLSKEIERKKECVAYYSRFLTK